MHPRKRLPLLHPVPHLFHQHQTCRWVDRVLLALPSRAEHNRRNPALLGLDTGDPPIPRSAHLLYHRCLWEPSGIVQHRDIPALCHRHHTQLFKCASGGNRVPGQFAAGFQRTFPGKDKHLRGKQQAQFGQIRRPVSLEDRDRLRHLERVAHCMAKRGVHIGDKRGHPAPVAHPDSHHLLRQRDRPFQRFQESPAAGFDVEQDRVRTGGEFFAHD